MSFSPLKENGVPPHERLFIGLLLASVGGFLEAYTYLLHGGVFCNAQTGNIVFLVLALSNGAILRALYYLAPIGAFVVGVLVTALMRKHLGEARVLRWEPILLAVEAALLFCIGFLPAGVPDAVANVTVAFICSMQYNTFRKTNGLPYATTFCTNNLRLTAENCYRRVAQKNKEAGRNVLRYLAIILAFAGGVGLGAVLAVPLGNRSIWVCSLLLLCAFAVLLHGNRAAKRSSV